MAFHSQPCTLIYSLVVKHVGLPLVVSDYHSMFISQLAKKKKNMVHLVGGFNPSEKYEFVSWEYEQLGI